MQRSKEHGHQINGLSRRGHLGSQFLVIHIQHVPVHVLPGSLPGQTHKSDSESGGAAVSL